MRYLLVILLGLMQALSTSAQRSVPTNIPTNALLYNSKGMGVSNYKQAAYYRVLGKDHEGKKIFWDYYITGQLKSEKHYISINKVNDQKTVLTGVCRTFYKSGRLESIMQYVNGKASGRAISFFSSGMVGMKLNYLNGVLNGPSYTYDKNGKLIYSTVWNRGRMVSEAASGHDLYIDRKTGVDMFLAKYSSDEALAMAKAHDVAKQEKGKNTSRQQEHRTALSKQKDELPSKRQEEAVSDLRNNRNDKADFPDDEELIAEIKYPSNNDKGSQDHPEKAQSSDKKEVDVALRLGYYPKNVEKEFSFPYLYGVIADANRQTNEIKFYDDIAMGYNLLIAQTLYGHGKQKELIYHYNMDYDEVASADKVMGSHPRQIGFWGTAVGNSLNVQRISIFTWSKAEMIHFAQAALKMGYKVLGGDNIEKLDGNFILEPTAKTRVDGYLPITINFTHQNKLYAGLYHIQMEIK